MDQRNRNIIALGLLTLVAAVAFFWGLYFLLGNTVFTGGTDIFVVLEEGAGLKRGDRVRLQGVEVGSVQSVRLTPENRVVAELRLARDVGLPADSRASITGDVFGAHSVELTPGVALVKLEEGDTIVGVPTPALTDLAAGLGAQASSVLRSADSLLSPAAVANVHAATAELPASTRELRAAFAELRLAAQALRRTAESVEEAQTGAAVARAVVEVERSAQALNLATATMHRSLGSFESVMSKIDQGQGTLGRLVNDTSLYSEFHRTVREFQQTAREVGALATDMRERPSRYINLKIF